MFLKQLYQYNKLLTFSVLLFFFFFVLFFVKAGFYASPATSAGMYSKKMYLKDSSFVYEFVVNGSTLNPDKLIHISVDQLQIITDRFLKHESRNSFVYSIMGKVFTAPKVNFFNTLTQKDFERWQANHLENFFGEKINAFQVFKIPVVWNGAKAAKIDSLNIRVLEYAAN